jgi:hypothetical protein
MEKDQSEPIDPELLQKWEALLASDPGPTLEVLLEIQGRSPELADLARVAIMSEVGDDPQAMIKLFQSTAHEATIAEVCRRAHPLFVQASVHGVQDLSWLAMHVATHSADEGIARAAFAYYAAGYWTYVGLSHVAWHASGENLKSRAEQKLHDALMAAGEAQICCYFCERDNPVIRRAVFRTCQERCFVIPTEILALFLQEYTQDEIMPEVLNEFGRRADAGAYIQSVSPKIHDDPRSSDWLARRYLELDDIGSAGEYAKDPQIVREILGKLSDCDQPVLVWIVAHAAAEELSTRALDLLIGLIGQPEGADVETFLSIFRFKVQPSQLVREHVESILRVHFPNATGNRLYFLNAALTTSVSKPE